MIRSCALFAYNLLYLVIQNIIIPVSYNHVKYDHHQLKIDYCIYGEAKVDEIISRKEVDGVYGFC